MNDELLTYEQVGELLKVCRRSLIRWQNNGILPAPVYLGRCVRFRKSDIERFLESGCVPHYKTRRAKS